MSAKFACALEDVGSQGRTSVADPTRGGRVLSPTVVAGVPALVGRDEAMGRLLRHSEPSHVSLGQVRLGMRQSPWVRRGRRQVALGGSGG